MREGGQVGLAHPGEQLAEGRVAGQVGAQHQRVDEEADQVIEGFVAPAGDRRPEGDVVAGNIGSSSYMNYTIIGDAVNIAARLCQRARAGEMLFSSAIKHSLDAHGMDIGATPLPPLQLRGRSNPIDIFCVPLQNRVQLSAGPIAA